MIFDKLNSLSYAQTIVVSAASTNVVDLGPPLPNSGIAHGADDPEILLNVNETFTAAGAATLTVTVRSSASSNMSSPVLHEVSTAIPVASLTAGSVVPFTPRIPAKAGRYVDVYYTVATGPMTAGAISAQVIADRASGF
jgi:hypothetical protein